MTCLLHALKRQHTSTRFPSNSCLSTATSGLFKVTLTFPSTPALHGSFRAASTTPKPHQRAGVAFAQLHRHHGQRRQETTVVCRGSVGFSPPCWGRAVAALVSRGL